MPFLINIIARMRMARDLATIRKARHDDLGEAADIRVLSFTPEDHRLSYAGILHMQPCSHNYR